MYYDKLVRDYVPDHIRADGHDPVTRILSEEEGQAYALKKLAEEVKEFIADPTLEERADIAAVLKLVDRLFGFGRHNVGVAIDEKAASHGEFNEMICLVEVKEVATD